MTPGHLTDQVSAYIEASGIGRKGSCHLFRHTMATLMLEGGADIRFIQAMLGHESLTSTQLNTRVSIRKLKEIHTATHPAAKLERKGMQDGQEDVPRPRCWRPWTRRRTRTASLRDDGGNLDVVLEPLEVCQFQGGEADDAVRAHGGDDVGVVDLLALHAVVADPHE